MKELELSFRSCVVDMPLSKERSVGKESRKRRAIVTSRLRMSSINLSLGVKTNASHPGRTSVVRPLLLI